VVICGCHPRSAPKSAARDLGHRDVYSVAQAFSCSLKHMDFASFTASMRFICSGPVPSEASALSRRIAACWGSRKIPIKANKSVVSRSDTCGITGVLARQKLRLAQRRREPGEWAFFHLSLILGPFFPLRKIVVLIIFEYVSSRPPLLLPCDLRQPSDCEVANILI
jgi:hypothetical protein